MLDEGLPLVACQRAGGRVVAVFRAFVTAQDRVEEVEAVIGVNAVDLVVEDDGIRPVAVAPSAAVLEIQIWDVLQDLVERLLLVLVCLPQLEELVSAELADPLSLEDVVLAHFVHLTHGVVPHFVDLLDVLIPSGVELLGAVVLDALQVAALLRVALAQTFHLLVAALLDSHHLRVVVVFEFVELLRLVGLYGL